MKKYLSYALILIGVIGFLYFQSTGSNEEPIKEPLNINYVVTTSSKSSAKYVEIRGEVRFPGVYEYQEGEIIKQIIDKAGGLTDRADISGMNQAEIIIGNSLIEIPKKASTEFVNNEVKKTIYIDIKGEVKNPGVYQVSIGLRVFEVIELAGGLTIQADPSSLNMSELVKDGMLILIPKITERNQILVFIDGEIKNSGYYTLETGATLLDLVRSAGGFTQEADINLVDFTMTLVNGELITIPKIQEKQMIYVSIQGEVVYPDVYYVARDITVFELIHLAGGLTEEANSYLIDFDQVLVLGSVVRIPGYTQTEEEIYVEQSGLININTADLETLSTLNGIGHILAQRIIDYRSEYGFFQTIEDIQLVSGIKTSVYEKIKESITV